MNINKRKPRNEEFSNNQETNHLDKPLAIPKRESSCKEK